MSSPVVPVAERPRRNFATYGGVLAPIRAIDRTVSSHPVEVLAAGADLSDPAAERAIVASLLVHPEAWQDVERLQPHQLADPRLRAIYAAALTAWSSGKRMGAIVVLDELRSTGRLPDAGFDDVGPWELATEAVHTRVPHLVEIVLDRWRARSMRDGLLKALRHLTEGRSADEVAPLLQQVAIAPPRAALAPADVLGRWAEQGPLLHARTGFPTLDSMTGGGFVFGQFVVLAGAPDAGKTAVVAQMLDGLATNAGFLAGILAVDEDGDQITTRLLQRRGFDRAACEGRSAADLKAMARALAELPFVIYDDNWTIEDAAADLARQAAARGVRAVLAVDSLQTVRSNRERAVESLREQVTARAQALKAAAGEHRMIVIATSEMARAAYRGGPGEPIDDMAAAKESGAIEYQAKVLLSIRSVPGDASKVLLRLAKNKNGPRHDPTDAKDGIYLEIDRRFQKLTETAREQNDRAEQDAKDAMKDQERMQDAALLAVVLAGKAMQAKDAQAALCAKVPFRKMGEKRWAASRLALGEALVERPAPGNRRILVLDGAKVPPKVLDLVPVASRPLVLSSTSAESRAGFPPVTPGSTGSDGGESVAPGPYVVGPARHYPRSASRVAHEQAQAGSDS